MGYQPESPRQASAVFNNRLKLLIGMAVLIAALGYFGYLAFKESTVYYLTVSELSERGPDTEDRFVRVSGKLIPTSYHRDPATNLATFALSDGDEELGAKYTGALPDLFFNEHSEVILEGNYGPDRVFETHLVIVKCPSKYVALEKENSEAS